MNGNPKLFKNTFNKVSEEFTKVFRVMFKGGNGILKLTDENAFIPFSTITKKGREEILNIIESYL